MSLNIPLLSVDKGVNLLSKMYISYFKNNLKLEDAPSVFLWGPPGVGKSQSIREIGNNLANELNKKINIIDVRLILFNPVDLRGIPTSNVDKTLAIWLKPKIFDMDVSSDVINILFLDELSQAPQSVQSAAYQITLDRQIGEHKLPKNCIVIAAGNRITDKSNVYQMPKALANRLLHFEIESNFDSWNRWAINNNINKKVLGFLKFKPDYLNNFNSNDSNLAYATPRSWEMVSNLLNNVSDNIGEIFDLIAGLIGNGISLEFKGFDRIFNNLPNVEKYLKVKKIIFHLILM